MKTDAEWRLWGKRDPLWGVASWQDRQRGGARPWTDDEFYALGDDWLDFLAHWEGYGLKSGTAIQIGCGAGRMTKRLAEHFDAVLACDVSEGMLQYARERVTSVNVDWRLSTGVSLPAVSGSAQAAFSCHVLQHFESNPAQLRCFSEIYRVLAPGGSLLVHLPIHSFPSANGVFAGAARLGYRTFMAAASVKASVKRAIMRLGGRPYMHGISIEQGALYARLGDMGFQRVEFRTFPVRTNGVLHSCVLATK